MRRLIAIHSPAVSLIRDGSLSLSPPYAILAYIDKLQCHQLQIYQSKIFHFLQERAGQKIFEDREGRIYELMLCLIMYQMPESQETKRPGSRNSNYMSR